MSPTLLESLTAGVRRAMTLEVDALSLDADSLRVEPLMNPGGFVNRSFRVTSGARRLHVKLGSTSETLPGLRRWRALAPLLSSRYHAPAMVGWVELEESGWAGPVFEWIDGARPGSVGGTLREEVVPVVARLHGDRELAARLPPRGRGDCAEAYVATLHDRFLEDLAFVAHDRPPFVDDALMAWMYAQVERLAASVRDAAAFAEPADTPTHGDLWSANLLVGPDGWRLLDWDGLALGDPALDWAMLLGPTPAAPEPLDPMTVRDVPMGAATRARLPLLARATVLDLVVDPLADWVQSTAEPEQGAEMRATNERVHAAALEAYRRHYGTSG